jgi:hypothetical protein
LPRFRPSCPLQLLEEKLSARFKTVQRAFITMDMDNDGFINLREFRIGMSRLR